MNKVNKKAALCFAGVVFLTGCAHTSNIAMISNGELEGKSLDTNLSGDQLSGSSCGHEYTLSKAVANALKDSQNDTLVNVKVETTTNLFVWGNCIKVSGTGLNSKNIQ